MQKSIALWNYGDDQIANARAFKQLGFEAFSFLGRLFDLQGPKEDEDTACCMAELQGMMTIHHRFPDPTKTEKIAAFMHNMEHIRLWQERYGRLNGLTFDFNHPLELLCPLLGDVVKMFRGSGVFLACEDHPLNEQEMGYFASLLTPEDDFGLLIDCGHMHLRHCRAGKNSPQDVLNAMLSLPLPLKEVHLSGNHGERDEHLAPEEGTFPMGAFIQGLHSLGFDGLCTIERVPRNEEYQSSLLRSQRSMDWFLRQCQTPVTTI